MKRRGFNLLAGTSTLALAARQLPALAQAADAAQLLKTTLTPSGAERAGNAAGTIPAWTGGFTTVPAGWDPATQMEPDFFASDSLRFKVDSSNMSQYADLLTDGVQRMIQTLGFSVNVYPTHRTAAAPQWIYDNILLNTTRAKLNPNGGRLGFTGGYGGIPFPIPDTTDPLAAGAQVIWNHTCRWQGFSYQMNFSQYVVQGGQLVLSGAYLFDVLYPYYDKNGSLESYDGYIYKIHARYFAPATQQGSEVIVWISTNPLVQPQIAWELLQGQGRVRKAPEISYDTPESQVNDVANYDENYGFYGALDRYDWKFLEKKEMLIPYNTFVARRTPASVAMQAKFIDPDVVRWELHRVWVVEATLHPGERNVLARRRFYVDEDTWSVILADGYDANGNLYKVDMEFLTPFPQVPSVFQVLSAVYNMQTGDYAVIQGQWGNPPYDRPINFFKTFPDSDFEPQTMAASASY